MACSFVKRVAFTQAVILILLGGLFSTTSVGQPKPEDWLLEVIDGPSQLGVVKNIAVDLNTDGRMDVLSASIEDGHLRSYINQGDLLFAEQIISDNVPGIFQVSLIDINSDGVMDILGTSIETDDIFIFQSTQGGFIKKVIASKSPLPTDARSGDFNGDGLIDVVSLSFGNDQVLLHLQINPGEFATSVLADNILGPRKIEVLDLDSDQRMDIAVVSSGDNSLRVFVNDTGVGHMVGFKEVLISDTLSGPRYLTSCEVNGDMFPEILIADTAADQIIMFSSNDGTTFAQSEVATMINGVVSMHCEDMDGDQELELLAVAVSSGEIYQLEITGDHSKTILANSRDGYLSLDVGDFDDDGFKEVLTQSFFEQRNLIYFPHFQNLEAVVWEEYPEGAYSVSSGDINADGTEDVVVASFRGDRVQWYDGKTFEKHLIAEGIDGAAEIVVVDLDQDGELDVISAASNNNRFYWHRNTGDEKFDTLTIFDQAFFANSITVGDVNGDGRLDVIGTSSSDDSVRWFNRNGLTFEANLIDQSNDAPNDVEVADMDGDGDLDLIVVNYFSDDISLCENHENMNFECVLISHDKNKAHSVSIIDYDSDGDQDFFLSASSDDQIWLFINDQNSGQFTEVLAYDVISPNELATNFSILATAVPHENEVHLYDILQPGSIPYLIIEQMVGASSVYFQKNRNYSLFVTSVQNSKLARLSLKDAIFQNNFEVN